MYIKEIELKNFKSFGKKVCIPLNNEFIVVTGPNGSGKSNVVDALLFALCLSSSRAMRAERLPDLIYRGDNGKNPNYTQVTVRLDNTSRDIPVDQDVVEISRKVKLNNNKYHSVYYFNGKPCSQGELQDHLNRAGITPEGYNVVMQGDVTRIIEMTPVERRKIVDEIAGVAEFDEKKRKSMAELDLVKERIGRVDVILGEVKFQLSKLKGERDKALSYKAKREEVQRQEAFLLLAKLKEAEKDLGDLEGELGGLEADYEGLCERSAARKEEFSSLESSLKELDAEIGLVGSDEQVEVKRRIEELKGEIAREEGRIEMGQRELAELDALFNKNYVEVSRLEQERATTSGQVQESMIRRASVQGELEEQTDIASKARKKIADADARYSRQRDELATSLRLREEARARVSDLVRERDRLLDTARRGTAGREGAEREIAEALAALEAADVEADGIRSRLAMYNDKALGLERDRDDMERGRLKVRREIAESDRELQRLQGEYARAEARLRAAEEKSGYSRAVEAVRSAMRRQMLQGLHGTIADLGDVTPKYAAALEIAAGGRLQSVVSDTDEDAAVAIDHLKRSQVGRATFLPLNKLDVRSLPDRPNAPGVVDYALNLINFDRKFLPAFWYVFRDTLVVEDLATARRMMGRYRMVTLEGDLVERSGAMTGGHYRSRVRFAADESRRLVELSERLTLADSGRSALLDRLDGAEEQISGLNRVVEELDKEISRATFRLEEIDASRPRLERAVLERRALLQEMDGEFDGIRDRLAALDGDIQGAAETLESLVGRTEVLERELSGSDIPELAARAEEAEAEAKRFEARLKEIDSEILTEKLREEGSAERLRELLTGREELEARKAEAGGRKRASEERIVDLKSRLVAASAREKEIEAELHGLKGEKRGLVERLLAAQRDLDQMEREADRLEARKTAAFGAIEALRPSVRALREEIEASGVDADQVPPSSEIITQKIKALEAAMLELEPVNMLAIDEYELVDKRYENLNSRRETLNREREEIIDKLERYDRMKKDAFLSCFDEINSNFIDIFKKMSGGEGELILADPKDPLSGGMTIKARPAGKVFHRLEAMSGGEKSLTALSFIFAIQRFRPAPFYAMDEIDMFLDGANVERVAKLIKIISAGAQFLVVSLRKPMIQQAKYTIGVTMQEKNITSVTGICAN